MDRPSKRNREHQQRRSHPINTGTARTGQQHPQQQQQTSGGNYSSTDSENDEGTAVYESLTHNRKPLQGNQGGIPGTEALAPRLLSNAGNEQRLLNLGLANAPTDGGIALRTTNLDDHSPTRANRKDYSKSQLYELLRLSSETGSPETDDVISETSNEHNHSDCPTVPVHSSSHTGSYVNPSTASDISCNALSPLPLYQCGVQQFSAQHLHHPFLTSPHHLLRHHHHHPGRPLYYSQDPHLLDDHQDKLGLASSPTTTSSDRCLLPASSSANIGKLSNNNGVIASDSRHLFGTSMSHPTDRDRPLSEHYLANTILRSAQCPIHTGNGSIYPSRANLRPAPSGKSIHKTNNLKRILTWRNFTAVLGLLCLALIGALGYFAVISGSHRHDDLSKCFRAQEVISPNQYDIASGSPRVRAKRNPFPNMPPTQLSTVVPLDDARTVVPTVLHEKTSVPVYATHKPTASQGSVTDFSKNKNDVTPPEIVEEKISSTNGEDDINLAVSPQQDHPQNDKPSSSSGNGEKIHQGQRFTILQTIVLSYYTDESGHSLPRITLQNPQIFSRDKLSVVSRSGRDVNDNESWEEKGYPYNSKESYPTPDLDPYEITFGQLTDVKIPARSFWLGRLVQKKLGIVAMNLTISPTASMVLYGRRDAPPTHSENSFSRRVHGAKVHKRAALEGQESELKSFHEKLDTGVWFLALYNDQPTEETTSLIVGDAGNSYCTNDCNGQGSCIDGICQCRSGFGGDDCSQAVCPVLCNGHGRYSHGACQCFPGWKGNDCDIPEFQCDDPTCNGRGKCWNGKCSCDSGFSGLICEAVECPKDCAVNGACINGTCFCQPGFQGVSCEIPVNDSRQLCSNHGNFKATNKRCECDPHWTGPSCNTELCEPACGINGRCVGGKCNCDQHWTGPSCDSPKCPECGPRGRCVNGTCQCEKGWSGYLCSTNVCSNDCSGHGSCVEAPGSSWKCQCDSFWKGDNCGTAMEKCDDGRDNDGDGVADCEDNDCCSADLCAENLNCISSPEPQEALLREPASPDTASFFERARFLVKENGVQSFADRDAFDHRRASILRGRVIDSSNVGLVGVRVSIQAPTGETSPWGFTVSRRDGTYDLLLNGGGSQTIVFQKAAYRQTSSTIAIGWNDFITVDVMKMFRETEAARSRVDFILPSTADASACDLFKIPFRPKFFPFWRLFPSGGLGSGPVLYYDARVLQQSFNVSGSDLRLNHFSSRANGFASLMLISLTDEATTSDLARITVRVSIAGLQEETIYDASPNLSHTFAWNGSNSYKQQVFGFSNAKVSIGYEGRNCRDIFWVYKVVKLKGIDLPLSEIGGWDLNAHHRYNPEGILHRGDGSNLYFSEGPLRISPAVGSGQLRAVKCRDGCPAMPALSSDLLAPVALTVGPDGSLYIGDFDLIRKMKPDGTVVSILQLQSPSMLHKYHMAVNPVNGQLYLSIAQILKIIRTASTEHPQDLSNNYDTVVGTGQQCFPRSGVFDCGEGVPSGTASMIFPKGITFDKTGILYIADGGSIRYVDEAGLIKTLVPQVSYDDTWKPLPCSAMFDVNDLRLRWPTSISVNTVDNSLFIVDDSTIYSLDKYRKARIVSGGSIYCGSSLSPPTSMAISPTGVIYTTEGSEASWQIRKNDGDISKVILNNCPCNNTDCGCLPRSSSSAKILVPGAIYVGPDDVLYVADMKALRIFRVEPAVPRQNQRMEYEIEAPEQGHVYTFDRFGHHLTTRNIFTSALMYQFTWNVDTPFGKLRSVRDSSDRTILIQRDYKSQVRTIECGNGWKMSIGNSIRGYLKDVTFQDGFQINYAYDAETTGLITGKSDSTGQSFSYKYDKYGRLNQVIYPNGRRLELPRTFEKTVMDGFSFKENMNKGTFLDVPSRFFLSLDNVHEIPLLNASLPTSLNFRTGNNGSVNFNMNYALRSEAPQRLRRSLKINDSTLFNVDYLPTSKEEFLTDREGTQLLSTRSDAAGRIVSMKPLVGDFATTNMTYNNAGRITKWEQGSRWKSFSYNEYGLPVSVQLANGANWKFEYNEKRRLAKVSKGSGPQLLLEYGATGGVQTVTLPKGNSVVFRADPLVYFQRYSVRDSSSKTVYTQDFDHQNKILGRLFPGGTRKTTFVYDDRDRIYAVFFGRGSFLYAYDEFGLVKQISSTMDGLISTTDLSFVSNFLIARRSIKYSGGVELESVTISYDYDDQLCLVRRKIQVGNNDVAVTEFQTNPKSRQITRFGPFSVSQSQVGAIVISDENAIFLKQLDALGKTRNLVLRLQQKIAASVEMLYNDIGSLSEMKLRKRENEPQISYSFKHDLEGQLIEATKNKQPWWNFAYDLNGNLFNMMGNNRLRNMTINPRDQIFALSFDGKDLKISFDQDGFLTQKGDLKYDFDSRGLLQRVTKEGSGGFDVKYFYDEKGRLIARQSTGNDVQQFVYGDFDREDLVTHIYQRKTSSLIQLFYDGKGQIIAMARDGNPYYILQSPLTVTMFDQQGKVVKEVFFAPFGEIEADSNGEFYYPFDQRRNLRDGLTKVVFHPDGAYDSEIGRFLSPVYGDLRKLALERLNPYLYHGNDPLLSKDEKRPLLDISDWFETLGLQTTFTGVNSIKISDLVNTGCSSVTPLLPVLNHSCSIQSALNTFQSYSITSPQPSFFPDLMNQPLTFSTLPPFYGRGIILSPQNSSLDIVLTGVGQRSLNEAMNNLLNNALLLPWHLPYKTKEVFFAVKKGGIPTLELDLSRLRTVLPTLVVSTNRAPRDISLVIQSESMVFNLTYSSDPPSTVVLLKEMVRQHLVRKAWEYEKVRISSGLIGSTIWNDSQKKSLLSLGYVPGYNGYFVRDVAVYPELANDPANVAFLKS